MKYVALFNEGFNQYSEVITVQLFLLNRTATYDLWSWIIYVIIPSCPIVNEGI